MSPQSEVAEHQMAAVRVGEGESATAPLKQIDVATPGPNEILVKINWTGLCGSDDALITDGWASSGAKMLPETNGIAGHEGAGVVAAVGQNMESKWKIGDRAGIKWITSICQECEFCLNGGGEELHCPNQKDSGVHVPGTFQQYAVTDGRYATRIPDGVSDEEVAPILCGGVTTYAAVKRSGVRAGQWLAIVGAGGGLGHMAVQYAEALGIRVIAVDHGAAKRDLCEGITGLGVHGVVVTAFTAAAYEMAPSLLRPKGTLVVVGLPHENKTHAGAAPLQLVLNQLSIVGSVVGTAKDVDEALDFTTRDLVHPVLNKGTLGEFDKFAHRMLAGEQAGRVVLKVS